MKKHIKRGLLGLAVLIIIIAAVTFYQISKANGIIGTIKWKKDEIMNGIRGEAAPSTKPGNKKFGEVLATYKSVSVYHNGDEYAESYGKNYSDDGYLYGEKWQCVEFIKRFYYQALKHRMPNVYGHAKDFFNVNIPQGEINKDRALRQYRNNNTEKPMPDDLMVFNDTNFGHVVIVTNVTDKHVEIIQQNYFGIAKDKYKIVKNGDNYEVGEKRKPAGWLRKDK